MSKLDKDKEKIGIFKFYLGIVTAILISVGASVVKQYKDNAIDTSFYLGILFIFCLSAIFALIANSIHKKINNLEDL